MKEIILILANKVEAKDVIYFLIIFGLISIVIFQEVGLRRKDMLFEGIMRRVSKEIGRLGTQVTTIAGIVHFLAFNRRLEDEAIGESKNKE